MTKRIDRARIPSPYISADIYTTEDLETIIAAPELPVKSQDSLTKGVQSAARWYLYRYWLEAQPDPVIVRERLARCSQSLSDALEQLSSDGRLSEPVMLQLVRGSVEDSPRGKLDDALAGVEWLRGTIDRVIKDLSTAQLTDRRGAGLEWVRDEFIRSLASAYDAGFGMQSQTRLRNRYPFVAFAVAADELLEKRIPEAEEGSPAPQVECGRLCGLSEVRIIEIVRGRPRPGPEKTLAERLADKYRKDSPDKT